MPTDIAVSQGNGIALISTSTHESLQVPFPMPELESNRNRSELLSVVSLDGDISSFDERQLISYATLEQDWRHYEVKSLAFDPSRNLFYFSHSLTATINFKLTNLCVFNLTSSQTKLLLQSKHLGN